MPVLVLFFERLDDVRSFSIILLVVVVVVCPSLKLNLLPSMLIWSTKNVSVNLPVDILCGKGSYSSESSSQQIGSSVGVSSSSTSLASTS